MPARGQVDLADGVCRERLVSPSPIRRSPRPGRSSRGPRRRRPTSTPAGTRASPGKPGKPAAAAPTIKRVTMSSKPSSSTDPNHIIDDGFETLVGADAVLGPAVVWEEAHDVLRKAVESFKDLPVKSWVELAARFADAFAAAGSGKAINAAALRGAAEQGAQARAHQAAVGERGGPAAPRTS